MNPTPSARGRFESSRWRIVVPPSHLRSSFILTTPFSSNSAHCVPVGARCAQPQRSHDEPDAAAAAATSDSDMRRPQPRRTHAGAEDRASRATRAQMTTQKRVRSRSPSGMPRILPARTLRSQSCQPQPIAPPTDADRAGATHTRAHDRGTCESTPRVACDGRPGVRVRDEDAAEEVTRHASKRRKRSPTSLTDEGAASEEATSSSGDTRVRNGRRHFIDRAGKGRAPRTRSLAHRVAADAPAVSPIAAAASARWRLPSLSDLVQHSIDQLRIDSGGQKTTGKKKRKPRQAAGEGRGEEQVQDGCVLAESASLPHAVSPHLSSDLIQLLKPICGSSCAPRVRSKK